MTQYPQTTVVSLAAQSMDAGQATKSGHLQSFLRPAVQPVVRLHVLPGVMPKRAKQQSARHA